MDCTSDVRESEHQSKVARPRVRALRRDARERREALLEAAAVCFEEQGFGVALEDIAERAGVGRGTLYRNFNDRMALIFAIFEREVERLNSIVPPERTFRETMTDMVRQGIRPTRLFARLATEMPPSGGDLTMFTSLGDRVEQLVEPLVEKAIAAGELRPGTTPAQVVYAQRMVNGLLLHAQDEEHVTATIDDALDLLLAGMAP